MAPLAVDPAALDSAGAQVISVGEGLSSAISTLTAALAGCDGMAGNDPAGAAFGNSYNESASKLLQAMTATRNGLCRLGDGVRMSAHNYSIAEAMSNIAGHRESLPGPHPTASISTGAVPSAVGDGVNAPAGWGWVAKYIGMIWPNGDSAKLRAGAAAWISAGTNFEVSEITGAVGPMGTIGAQQIPEASAISAAFVDAKHSVVGILQHCNMIGIQLNTLATKIDTTHAAIIDLLSRICDPTTGIKEVWEFLTDQDEDEIKKIADDIRVIVNQFTSEVRALSQQLASTLSETTTILNTMGHYAEKEWDQFLHHTDVGRALNQVGQYGKGLGESAWGLVKDGWTYGAIRPFVDPQGSYQSWKELLHGMAPLAGLGDDHAPGVAQSWKELGKNAVHWDEWKTNPAEAAGKSTFDLATLLVPGGGEAAMAAKGGRAAVDGAEAATRAEAAATRALEDLPKPHAPAPAPHPEPPASPRAPADRPAPADKAPEPAQSKPASAPAQTPTHHGPTESKPPAAERGEAGAQHSSPPAQQPPDGAAAHEADTIAVHPSPAPTEPASGGASAGTPHGVGDGGIGFGDGHGGSNGHGPGGGGGANGHGGDGARGHGGGEGGHGSGGDGHGNGAHGVGDGGRGGGHGAGDGHGGKPDPAPNNPAHTGLHDPPAFQGIPGDRLPDLNQINNEYRLPSGEVDPDRIEEWAERISDQYPTLTKDGVQGVYDYTTENYDGMNPYLRNIDPLSPQQQEILDAHSIEHMTDGQREAWEARITQTDEGLAGLPPYRADPADAFSTTWRGLRAPDSLLDQFKEGQIFSDPAYLSTSTDATVAEQFALGAGENQTPTLLRVDGVDGVDVMQLSRYAQESEILFPRSANFEVLSKVMGDDGILRITIRQLPR